MRRRDLLEAKRQADAADPPQYGQAAFGVETATT